MIHNNTGNPNPVCLNHAHLLPCNCFNVSSENLGQVVQSPIKLTQDWQEFWIQFCNFLVTFSVYIVCPSGLSSKNLKLHKAQVVENIFIQERLIIQLTYNSGLALTSFQITQPWWLTDIKLRILSYFHHLPAWDLAMLWPHVDDNLCTGSNDYISDHNMKLPNGHWDFVTRMEILA